MAAPKYVVANWKMNLDTTGAAQLARAVVAGMSGVAKGGGEAWIAPASLLIPAVAQIVRGSPVRLGAQNVQGVAHGAFTGENSPALLREFGVSFALVGHSERRHLFFETDELIAARAIGALGCGLDVIYCVGETLVQREQGQTAEVLRRQLGFYLDRRSEIPAQGRLLMAYEPVWAIGTGRVAAPEDIEQAHATIASCFEAVGISVPPILYGGSVTPDNFGAILKTPRVDGGLIGGASLKAESFLKLVACANGA